MEKNDVIVFKWGQATIIANAMKVVSDYQDSVEDSFVASKFREAGIHGFEEVYEACVDDWAEDVTAEYRLHKQISLTSDIHRLRKKELFALGAMSFSITQTLMGLVQGSNYAGIQPEYVGDLATVDVMVKKALEEQINQYVFSGGDKEDSNAIPEPVVADEDFYFTEYDQPTGFLFRFQSAMALLCNDHIPSTDLCARWLLDDDDLSSDARQIDLQEWALEHSKLNWPMGIGIIEAALTLAHNPAEGVDHESQEEAINALRLAKETSVGNSEVSK